MANTGIKIDVVNLPVMHSIITLFMKCIDELPDDKRREYYKQKIIDIIEESTE